jgi:hypothetical protein
MTPTSRKPPVEPIAMRARRFGYFPKTFVWRGKTYNVEAVERCHTTAQSRRGRPRLSRHNFRVRCAEGTFDIFQDLQHNTWHIQVPNQGS